MNESTPRDATTIRAMKEWVTLCGPCEHLMTFDEYNSRRAQVVDAIRDFDDHDRTVAFYALAEHGSDERPELRPTPGLTITPEVYAAEELRLHRLICLEEDDDRGQDWDWLIYTDPIVGSFTYVDCARYAHERSRIVFQREFLTR